MAKALGERDNPRGTGCNGAAGAADGVAMMATPTKTWLKLTRRLGRDGNPLRRRADVLAGWLLPGTMVVFLVLGPLVAGLTSVAVRADNSAARHVALGWQPVRAVLLQAAPGPEESDQGANTWTVWTRARWTADGHQYVGDVPAAAGSAAGSTETVWLDPAGKVQLPPLTGAQDGSRVVNMMLVALAGLAALLAAIALAAWRILDRRRLAGWETAWLAVGPGWSRQA